MSTESVPLEIKQDFFYRSFNDDLAIDRNLRKLRSNEHAAQREQAILQLKHLAASDSFLQNLLQKGIVEDVCNLLSDLPDNGYFLKVTSLDLLLRFSDSANGRQAMLNERVISIVIDLLKDTSDDIRIKTHALLKELSTAPIFNQSLPTHQGSHLLLSLHAPLIKVLTDRLPYEPLHTVSGLLECLSTLLTPSYFIPTQVDSKIYVSKPQSDILIYTNFLPFLRPHVPYKAQRWACECIAGVIGHPNSTPPIEELNGALKQLMDYHGGVPPLETTRGLLRVLGMLITNTEAKKIVVGSFQVEGFVKLVVSYKDVDQQIVIDGLQVLTLVAEDSKTREVLLKYVETLESVGTNQTEYFLKRTLSVIKWQP